MQTCVQFEKVKLEFQNRSTVLENLSMQINVGEFVCLLGPSGSGKSTILKLVAGLLQPTQGKIERKFLKSELAYIFQDANLLSWRTVRENVQLPLELLKLNGDVDQALRFVGLADHAEKYPSQLSGGMKMRTSIARSIVYGPRVLLMDEPFAALDEPNRHRLQEEIYKLSRQNGWTVIFVTHSPSEAAFLASRVLVLPSSPKNRYVEIRSNLVEERDKEFRYESGYLNLCRELSGALENA